MKWDSRKKISNHPSRMRAFFLSVLGRFVILVTRLCEVECLEYRFLLEHRICKLTTLLNPIFTWFCRKANLTGRKQTKFGKSTSDILKDIIATHAVQCSNISKAHYLRDEPILWVHPSKPFSTYRLMIAASRH